MVKFAGCSRRATELLLSVWDMRFYVLSSVGTESVVREVSALWPVTVSMCRLGILALSRSLTVVVPQE